MYFHEEKSFFSKGDSYTADVPNTELIRLGPCLNSCTFFHNHLIKTSFCIYGIVLAKHMKTNNYIKQHAEKCYHGAVSAPQS